jgi:uncharacterized protein
MIKKPLFVVSASTLDAGGESYARPIPNAWLVTALADTEAKALGDGTIDLRLSKSGTDVVVHGKVKADVEVPCARCLEPVRVTLAPEISVLFEVRGKKHPPKEVEISRGEADVLPYDGDQVVLDDMLRDDLVLEIPMIPLCSETCPGIASHGEAPESGSSTIDPRLAPLLALKKHKE